MTVYSYNANQLQKKVAPKKPFWSGNKIAVAVASGFILLFGSLVAIAPKAEVGNAPAASITQVTAPKHQAVEPSLSTFIQKESTGYTCVNQQSGDKLFSSDYTDCVKYVKSYRCALDDNWSVEAAGPADCEKKQKETVAKKNAEFNLDSYKEDYRNALINLEQKTR